MLNINKLVDGHTLISEQINKKELVVILQYLVKGLEDNPEGQVVEFGCYSGTTSLFIRRVLDKIGPDREFHVYDSFEGLPPKTLHDSSPVGEQFVEGELKSTKKEFVNNFKKSGLNPPIIHKSWFSNLSKDDIPEKICFAFLDGDYYKSIMESLRLIENKLTGKSIIVVDDYLSEELPGTKIAVDEWLLKNTRHKLLQTINSLAIIGDGRVSF